MYGKNKGGMKHWVQTLQWRYKYYLNLKHCPDIPFLVPDSLSAPRRTSEMELLFSEWSVMSSKGGMQFWMLSIQGRDADILDLKKSG